MKRLNHIKFKRKGCDQDITVRSTLDGRLSAFLRLALSDGRKSTSGQFIALDGRLSVDFPSKQKQMSLVVDSELRASSLSHFFLR